MKLDLNNRIPNVGGSKVKKLLLIAMICIVSAAYCLQNNIFGAITPSANSHILATNFPTPGWPVCSKCGKYHPGEECSKE
ncbi:hypothetical protein LCGC14_1496730 [marine sediment metagenome]|uniref:Uncharacterized protein n=1 Tax=marine sediment metagenome TaxID=412755 RepID=A0A0F9JR57_9ZZZZ